MVARSPVSGACERRGNASLSSFAKPARSNGLAKKAAPGTFSPRRRIPRPRRRQPRCRTCAKLGARSLRNERAWLDRGPRVRVHTRVESRCLIRGLRSSTAGGVFTLEPRVSANPSLAQVPLIAAIATGRPAPLASPNRQSVDCRPERARSPEWTFPPTRTFGPRPAPCCSAHRGGPPGPRSASRSNGFYAPRRAEPTEANGRRRAARPEPLPAQSAYQHTR